MKFEEYASPEEIKRLASALLTVLVGIFIAALFEFIVVPSLRVANQPAGPEVLPQGATGWLDPTEYPAAKGRLVPPADPRTVMTATPELLARGKSLFAKNCAQCHGESGRGDGPAAKTAEPPPRDFSQPKGWKRGYGLAMVLKTISAGSAGTAMAAFDYIQPKDRMALAHYVQSLGAFLHPEAPQALAALARSFASSGLRVPNKIPVSLAMKKLAEEQVVPRPLRLSGAAARAISDPQRAAVWLQNSTVWRKGSRALAEAALAQAPDNGFSVAGAQLTPADWGALFDSIRRR